MAVYAFPVQLAYDDRGSGECARCLTPGRHGSSRRKREVPEVELARRVADAERARLGLETVGNS
jgi:hypothetical protein